jgi:hypothetical protein
MDDLAPAGYSNEGHIMTKVILTAQVKDVDAWEKAFLTHGQMFKSQGVMTSPVLYAKGTNNEVVLCTEVPDASAYRQTLSSPETVAAMEQDGVKVGTVKLFVLDKDLKF